MLKRPNNTSTAPNPVTLRTVAERCGLAPCSVSAVLNNSQAAMAIPQRTKERVLQAVRELNYRPNFSARSLRTKRTFLVAVIASDIGNPQVARIISGVEMFLRANGYCLLIMNCDRSPGWFEQQSFQLLQRGVEGVITIDITTPRSFTVPVVFMDLPATEFPEPMTPLKRQRLTAMGEVAAQSAIGQITQRSHRPTRVALAPEPLSGMLPAETAVTVRTLPQLEYFAD